MPERRQSTPPAPPAAEPAEPEPCAVCVIDADGRLVAANQSARRRWQLDVAAVGRPFADLLQLDAGAGAAGEQWKRLKAALDTWLPCTARSATAGSEPVWMRLERATGGAGSYIATVQARRAGA